MKSNTDAAPAAATGQFLPLDIRRLFNNDGVSYDHEKCDGDFDGKGATFPAEELPPSHSLITIDGIPMIFPGKETGQLNNVVLNGQTVPFDPIHAQTLFVLGASDGQNGEVFEEELTVSYADGGCEPVYVGLSNWLLLPRYNERVGLLCSHLHFPDPGQQTVISKASAEAPPSPLVQGGAFTSVQVDAAVEGENASRGIWRPRLFLQRVALDPTRPALGLTFMENFNFHVFAMTIETRRVE